MKKLFLLLAMFALSGCVAVPDKGAKENAYFGQPPNEQQKMPIIIEYVRSGLIDPDSLKIRCTGPVKGWARPYLSDPVTFGYFFPCYVNAKNRMGGYAGEKLYVFLFNDRGQQVFTNESTARGPLKRGMEFDIID